MIKDDWEKQRDELIKLKKERLDLEAQFVPTMITKAVDAARDSHPAARQLDGRVGRGRRSRTCRTFCSRSTRAAGARPGSTWRTGSCRASNPLTARVVVNRLWKRSSASGCRRC